MSFLGSLVNSIGGEKAPAPPLRPPTRPSSTAPAPPNPSKSAPATPITASTPKPLYKGTAGTLTNPPNSGLKRKADEITSERSNPSNLDGGHSKSPAIPKSTNGIPPAQLPQNATKAPARPPSKGSYAAIMARAKEAAQSKTPSQIGIIKHQATEKVKTSKLAERKRLEQEKGKGTSGVPPGKPGSNGKNDPRRRSASPAKKGELPASKVLKGPKPPLHAPAYKGTMGQGSKRPREDVPKKKSSRYDQYLDTDEEEEDDDDDGDDHGEGGGYDDWTEESDMEGGFDELEAEERSALRAAKNDDAYELALENKLKKEKLERKQKLEALAARRR